MAQRAHKERETDDAVGRDHHGSEDGVARECAGLTAARQHEREDEADLDDRDRDREHEGAIGLADLVGDDLGVPDRGEDSAGGIIGCDLGTRRRTDGGRRPISLRFAVKARRWRRQPNAAANIGDQNAPARMAATKAKAMQSAAIST